jgi:hypothetical protein
MTRIGSPCVPSFKAILWQLILREEVILAALRRQKADVANSQHLKAATALLAIGAVC